MGTLQENEEKLRNRGSKFLIPYFLQDFLIDFRAVTPLDGQADRRGVYHGWPPEGHLLCGCHMGSRGDARGGGLRGLFGPFKGFIGN